MKVKIKMYFTCTQNVCRFNAKSYTLDYWIRNIDSLMVMSL